MFVFHYCKQHKESNIKDVSDCLVSGALDEKFEHLGYSSLRSLLSSCITLGYEFDDLTTAFPRYIIYIGNLIHRQATLQSQYKLFSKQS